jgi:MFS family permease
VTRFAPAYILAMFGTFMAFMPMAALILPATLETLPGGGGMRPLSWLLLAGGAMASVGNIGAGRISDWWFARTGNRRAVIGGGLIAVMLALAMIALTRDFMQLLGAVLAFQLAVNLLLAPLSALMVDYVPHGRRGRMSGWISLALPAGALVVPLLVALALDSVGAQLMVIATLTALFVAPLAIGWRVPPLVHDHAQPVPQLISGADKTDRRNFTYAWIGRMLIQFAAAAILSYLYYYAANGDHAGATRLSPAARVAALTLIFTVTSAISGLGAGMLADRFGRHILMLAITATAVCISMILLATATWWAVAMASYALFAAALSAFLTVDSALIARLVAQRRQPATLLGIMNLTNTLPGMIAAAVALFLPQADIISGALRPLLLIAAGAALVASLCVSRIRVTV